VALRHRFRAGPSGGSADGAHREHDDVSRFGHIQKVEEKAQELGLGQVVSVIGRFWALDREENWDRVAKCYRQLVDGEGTAVPSS